MTSTQSALEINIVAPIASAPHKGAEVVTTRAGLFEATMRVVRSVIFSIVMGD